RCCYYLAWFWPSTGVSMILRLSRCSVSASILYHWRCCLRLSSLAWLSPPIVPGWVVPTIGTSRSLTKLWLCCGCFHFLLGNSSTSSSARQPSASSCTGVLERAPRCSAVHAVEKSLLPSASFRT